MVRLGHRWSPAGDTNWDGNTVERTSRWQQSLLDCHVSRPRKTTPNDPNAALWEQRAPSHCPQHHPPAVTVTGQGQGYRAVDWLLHQLPVCPVCPSRAVPQGEGTGTWQQPSPQEKDRATPHPWEAPGGTFLSDHGERGQKGHTKDGINAAFLLHSLWMGNSLLTVPKSYRDTLDINFHITRTSEPPCNAAPLQLAPPHPPPLLWSTQLHLRQYFPISRAPCPVTHALSGQKSAGNCL